MDALQNRQLAPVKRGIRLHTSAATHSSGRAPSTHLVLTRYQFGCRFLTGSIEEVSKSYGISQSFLGLIVLPIAGNACEHITAVFVAAKDKMVRWRLNAHPVSTDCCSEAFIILTHYN